MARTKRSARTTAKLVPAPKQPKMPANIKAELSHLVRNDLFAEPGTVYDIIMNETQAGSVSLRGQCTLETKGANRLELKPTPVKSKAAAKRQKKDPFGYWLGSGMWSCVPKPEGEPNFRICGIEAIDGGTLGLLRGYTVYLDHATPGEVVIVNDEETGKEETVIAQQGDLVLVYWDDPRETGTVLFRPRMSKEAAAVAEDYAAELAQHFGNL